MNIFENKVAEMGTTTNRIIDGRQKITTSELIYNWPGGVTVTGFDILTGKKGDYAVISFKEDPARFYSGGKALTEICKSWAEMFNTIEDANDSLAAAGGARIKLEQTVTRDGRPYIRVTVGE